MILNRMPYWTLFFYILVTVSAQSGDSEVSGCDPQCIGEEYECINEHCYCADGYILNRYQTACVKCPEFGEKCHGPCCNNDGNGTLHCWYGVCQPCRDEYGNWICRDSLDQILLITTTQAIMGTALVLGIIATFVLLFKLCTSSNIRPMGNRPNYDSRLSIGSLQVYIEERLRDAPPRYSRTPSTDATVYPAIAYLNNGFIHDSSVPPPPYSPENKDEENENTANPSIHI